jgi:predicted O-methyltransferase YrrM
MERMRMVSLNKDVCKDTCLYRHRSRRFAADSLSWTRLFTIERMTDQRWTDVNRYLHTTLFAPDAVLEATLEANAAAGLPAIDVTATQGRFLQLQVRILGARRVLEIGTLGAYSTIWMARALPADGTLITLEFDPHHAAVARANLARAGLSKTVELRLGPAADSLERMVLDGEAPFDLIFIDADKPNNAVYLAWAMKLAHPGTLLICDNVVRDGEVANPESTDRNVIGTRTMFAEMGADPRLISTALQTVGAKGYDGFAIALVADVVGGAQGTSD